MTSLTSSSGDRVYSTKYACLLFLGCTYPYISGLLHRYWGNHMIAPVPVKQPWNIRTNIQPNLEERGNIVYSSFDILYYHFFTLVSLTHWSRVTHICVSKLNITGSDNGLLPDRCQAIIWTDAGILLIGPLGTNVSETLIEIHTFSFMKMHLKMSSGKWRPFCLSLNVLTLLVLKLEYSR